MSFGPHAAARLHDLAHRHGTTIILRRLSKRASNSPQPNPPILDQAKLAAASQGATSLSLTGRVMSGRFLVGDKVIIPGHAVGYPITAEVTIANNAATLPLARPLSAAVPLDTAPGFSWACDEELVCFDPSVSHAPMRDPGVRSSSLSVIISSASTQAQPAVTDLLMFGGRTYAIEAVMPMHARGVLTGWQITARA